MSVHIWRNISYCVSRICCGKIYCDQHLFKQCPADHTRENDETVNVHTNVLLMFSVRLRESNAYTTHNCKSSVVRN